MESENKQQVLKELEELFKEVSIGKAEQDFTDNRRRVEFYTNKIHRESQIDKESLAIQFTI